MKKITALLLTAVMLLGCVPGLAETTKHERVFVVAGADGTVESLTDVIRLENADGLDEIEDRSALSAIENVNGDETFSRDGETLVWKAAGKSITYQGTSDKAPAVLPVVTLTLDGETVSAEDLKDRSGDVVLTVTYQVSGQVPSLAVTLIPLPETGVSGLAMENAVQVDAMGRQVVVGWALPGMDESLSAPASFTVSFHADHVSLPWMMTLTTSDPINAVCGELDRRISLDLHTELDEGIALLTALKNGEELPANTGKTKVLIPWINQLNTGLADLDAGARTLADGAAEAETGAASLDSGLAMLTSNNESLNSGAEAIFTAMLNTANQQLAASGLEAAGIAIPELTAENYGTVLDAAIAQLDPEALRASAYAQVETVVRPKVEAGREEIRTAVTAAAKARVLEAVLKAAGLDMTAEQYAEALQNGKIPKDKATAINDAVDSRMASEEVQAQIETAVQEQVDLLVREKTEEYLAADETVNAKLSAAQQAREKLIALKAQLDQLNTFVAGLKAYTDGVSRASAGASELHTGLTQLKIGASTLHTNGTLKLKTGILTAEKTAAEKLLPYLTNEAATVLRLYEETRDSAGNAGYDLRPEGMRAVTVCIIRTDLQ